MHKTWNVRDQTEQELKETIERQYDLIDKEFRGLRRIADLEEAQKALEIIWRRKKLCNDIHLELIRREYYGTSE